MVLKYKQRSFAGIIGFFFVLLSQRLLPVYAESSLTTDQKNERRQELSQSIKASDPLRAEKKNEYSANPWVVSMASNFGYDRNVTFDSRRLGDTFHQETAAATYTENHGKLAGFIPEGKYGVAGSVDQFDYSKRNESDYRNFKVNPFFTTNLTQADQFRTEYTMRNVRYLKSDQINYFSHEIKNSLTDSRFAHWLHTVYVSIDFRDYTDRFSLDAAGAASTEKRADVINEYGYTIIYYPSEKLVFGATGAYKGDDSSDNFKNYSDYDGYKTIGFIYAVLNDRTSWVGAAGWDQRWFKAKTLSIDPAKNESDGFLYFATYLYYNLTPKTQFVVSYLWDQDFSNDPLLQFNGSMVTAGFSVKI